MEGDRFTSWLDEEMALRNWRPADLVRASGISSGTLSHIYAGTRKIGPEVATAIATALDLSPEYVFRKAGLLPEARAPDRDPSFQEILEIMRGMTTDERREVVDYALFRARRKGRGQ